MTKDQQKMEEWIKDTQMFQRIAGVKESSYEVLANDWSKMKNKIKKFNIDDIKTHRIIQDTAIKAGESRKN